MSNHYPRKRFGQHFLRDQRVIYQIISAINPRPDDHMVEIGPGDGAITKILLTQLKTLMAVEIDRDLIARLTEDCATVGTLVLYQADALKFDYASLITDQRLLRIVGNLPYNISTPLLFHLFGYRLMIQDMYFMLQKEVVERLNASKNDSAYGRLSVMAQYHCAIDMLFTVPAEAFSPPPQVESAVVRLIPHQTLPHLAKDYGMFENVVRLAFNQRRKTLRNCLKSLVTAEQLTAIAIDPQWRPEDLDVGQFVAIANAICVA